MSLVRDHPRPYRAQLDQALGSDHPGTSSRTGTRRYARQPRHHCARPPPGTVSPAVKLTRTGPRWPRRPPPPASRPPFESSGPRCFRLNPTSAVWISPIDGMVTATYLKLATWPTRQTNAPDHGCVARTPMYAYSTTRTRTPCPSGVTRAESTRDVQGCHQDGRSTWAFGRLEKKSLPRTAACSSFNE